MSMEIRNGITGVTGGLTGAFLAIWLGYVISDIRAKAQIPGNSPSISDKPPVPAAPPGNNNIIAPNNSGIITHGQTGNNTINQGPIKLKFTDALGAELLAKLPMNKVINLKAVRSQSDQAVGLQIASFLKSHGYQIEVFVINILSPPPDHALTWDAAKSQLIIAPSAR